MESEATPKSPPKGSGSRVTAGVAVSMAVPARQKTTTPLGAAAGGWEGASGPSALTRLPRVLVTSPIIVSVTY